MRCSHIFLLLFTGSLIAGSCLSQSDRQMAPVPDDPLELATGPLEIPQTPDQRAEALSLLERARQNYNLRTSGSAPYHLKVSFNAGGETAYSGAGEMEEMWVSDGLSRWTARLGSYSESRVFYRGRGYDSNPGAYMPLRLQMLRSAIYWPVVGNFANAALRIGPSNWNGSPVDCVLTSGARSKDLAMPGRRWYEEEFCIDAKSGLLQTYSVAPGIYAVFDYASGVQFHGHALPHQISILVADTPVIQAQLDSVTDVSDDPAQFTPSADMQSPAIVIRGPLRFPLFLPSLSADNSATIRPVIVHAVLTREGHVLEAEPLQIADSALASAAVDAVKKTQYSPAAAPIQREVFINVQFVPPKIAN